MKKISKWLFALVALISMVCCPSVSHALTAISGSGSLGSYTGSLEYKITNATTAELKVILKNTSPALNGGYLTAFVFNNPSGQITGVSLTPSDLDFNLFGGASFTNTINAGPYGQFDIGSGTGSPSNFEGGGTPSDGIAVGNTETFLFGFTGAGLNTLTEQSFLNALSVPPGDGEGTKSFVARFRGFEDDGSDKVPGLPGGDPQDPVDPENPAVPEPATMLLFGIGLLGVAKLKRNI